MKIMVSKPGKFYFARTGKKRYYNRSLVEVLALAWPKNMTLDELIEAHKRSLDKQNREKPSKPF